MIPKIYLQERNKIMKKTISMLLAVMMLAALSVTAFAANDGSITINGVSDENTYAIYQLLDLESYDKTSGAYSYKVNADWTGFFATVPSPPKFSAIGFATCFLSIFA